MAAAHRCHADVGRVSAGIVWWNGGSTTLGRGQVDV